MNTELFDPVIENVYRLKKQYCFIDCVFPKNTLIYFDYNTMYLCDHYPAKYKGIPDNLILNFTWIDLGTQFIGHTTIKGGTICEDLWLAYSSLGTKELAKNDTQNLRCPEKICHELTADDYKNMMRHDRRKKSGSGGVRLSAKSDEYTTDALRYNQVTESAYWANLNNSKSGNASMIASNIR